MNKGKIKTLLLSLLLNVIIPILFWICLDIIYKTDIVLYFSKPVSTKPVGIIALIIFPLYLIINFVIHTCIYVKRNGKNKALLIFKQIIVSFVLYVLIFNISLMYSSLFKTIVFEFKSPDNKTTYIFEEISQRYSSSITIKKGNYISAEEQTCIETNYSRAAIEVSWIDDQYFNIKLLPPPDQEGKEDIKALCYTYTSSKQFEEVEESEYDSQKYIKTDKLTP